MEFITAAEATRLARPLLQAKDGAARLSACLIFSYASAAARAASVLLHLPGPEGLPPATDALPLLPPGLRLFACYASAHRLYLDAAYETSLGMVLAARGWTNQEIAEHMGFSVNRVKECLSNAFRKLGVTSRKELGRFMLS